MTRPTTKLDLGAVEAFVAAHPGWELTEQGALARRFSFADFASGLGFAVRVGCLAEKRDHHPVLQVAWGSVGVTWSTHDAGGITQRDLAAAEATDALSR